MLVVLTVVLLLALEGYREAKREDLVTRYQYSLFAMRDELRGMALLNPGLASSWVFSYLDSTTTKTISLLPSLSIWKLLALAKTYQNDSRQESLIRQLRSELAKPQFMPFQEYEKRLIEELGCYMLERHQSLIASVDTVDRVSTRAKEYFTSMKRRSLELAVQAPETSTLAECAP